MNSNQKTFRKYLLFVFADQRRDIVRTIVWLSNHFNTLPYHYREAYNELTSAERNAVVREVLMDGH